MRPFLMVTGDLPVFTTSILTCFMPFFTGTRDGMTVMLEACPSELTMATPSAMGTVTWMFPQKVVASPGRRVCCEEAYTVPYTPLDFSRCLSVSRIALRALERVLCTACGSCTTTWCSKLVPRSRGTDLWYLVSLTTRTGMSTVQVPGSDMVA